MTELIDETDQQQMLAEREEMAMDAIRECVEKGVSPESVKTIAFEMGLKNNFYIGGNNAKVC